MAHIDSKHRLGFFAVIAMSILLFFLAPVIRAEPFDFGERVLETVGSEDEIPDGMITALAQGTDGFLWIGTQDGLLRFDGYRFQRFRHRIDDPHSMAGKFVFSLAVGADGRVWIGHEVEGVSVLDPDSEKFVRYRHRPGIVDGIGPGNIYAIAVAPDGGVFIAADSGLVRYDPAGAQFTPIALGPGAEVATPGERVRSLWFGRNGVLWIGTQDGLSKLEPGAVRAERVMVNHQPVLPGREIVALLEDRRGRVICGTRENGASVVDFEQQHITDIGSEHPEAPALARSWVNAIAEVANDEIWLSRYGSGVALVDARTLRVNHLMLQDASAKSGLSFDAVGAFWVDRAGLLWIGSWGGGLQRHNPRNRAIQMLRYSALHPGRLSYANLLSVLERRDGSILAGTTQNGIDIIDPERGVIGGWRADPGGDDALSDGVIGGMGEAADGTLWIGTFQSGVDRLDPGAKSFRRYRREQGLPSLQAEVVEIARDGRVFVGTGDGLVRYDAANDRFVDVLDIKGIAPRTRFNSMNEAEDGRIWFGSANSLYLLEAGAERLRHFAHDPNDPRSLDNDVVAQVVLDASGTVWVNTQRGLDRYHREADGREWFEHVTQGLGLDGESLGSNLLVDARGWLWSNTARFDPATRRVDRLHRADGLDVGTNWVGAATKTRSGRLLFGGTNGLAIVDPEHVQLWSFVPEVLITEVTVDGQRRPGAARERSISLAPAESRFDVEFAASDFSTPALLRYAYRLRGNGDDAWVEVDAEHRHASFGNLWPGEYTLEVRATNRVGETSAKPAQVTVRVWPKWWQHQLTMIGMAFIALFVIVLASRLTAARHRSRAVHLQALVDERTQALREAFARAEQASRTDPLTGLGNRRSLELALQARLDSVRIGGEEQRRLALIVLDIDEFKQVNDLYGHAAGDLVLQEIAQLIRQQLRSADLGVRWGGEEFLIVVAVADEVEAMQRAQALREAVAAHRIRLADGRALSRTCSIGFACLPFAPDQPQVLEWPHVLEIADAALFDAKRDGRNRVYGYVAEGLIEPDFIERFRSEDQAERRQLPLRRLGP